MHSKREEAFLYLSIIAVFSIGQSIGAIDGAIAKIATAFGIPQSTAMYCSTVGSIVSVFASLAVGSIAGRKVGFGIVARISGFLLVAGGVLPFFAQDFVTVCLFRAVFGIGLGGMLAVQNPIAVLLVSDEQKRARVLGVGTFVAFAFNCVEDVVGGVLADISWNYAFLTYAILAVPYLFYLISLPKVQVVHEPNHENTDKQALPARAIGLFVMTFLCGLSITPLLVGCSFLSTNIVESATVAGIAALAFSIGCMFGGMAFPIGYKHLGAKCMILFCVFAAAGLVICGVTRNIFALMAGLAIGGFGFSSMMACSQMLVGLLFHPSKVAIASGLLMGALNLGAFLCTNWMDVVGSVTGDPLYNTVFIGAGTYLCYAVLLTAYSARHRAVARMSPAAED